MVRLFLKGGKRQVRVPMKRQPRPDTTRFISHESPARRRLWWPANSGDYTGGASYCPFGEHGYRIWIKEACRLTYDQRRDLHFVQYRADGVQALTEQGAESWIKSARWKNTDTGRATPWLSANQMPRWAARIESRLTGIRVERLNDISVPDCMAEGVTEGPSGFANGVSQRTFDSARQAFADLWRACYPSTSFDPLWVWALAFGDTSVRTVGAP